MTGTCNIEGCGRPSYARGWCVRHYNRWRNYGDPLTAKRGEQQAQVLYLLHIVLPHRGDTCLMWPFHRNDGGYGEIRLGGRTCLVHREVCWAMHGAPPAADLEVRHSCGLGHEGCVAPLHLTWGTPRENQRDRLVHGTHSRGEKSGLHKLTREQADWVEEALSAGKSQSEVAASLGVSQQAISAIHRGVTWAWRKGAGPV